MRFSFEKRILVKNHYYYYYYYYYYYIYLSNLNYILRDTRLPAIHVPYIKTYNLHHLQFNRQGRRCKQLLNVLKEDWDGSVSIATRYKMVVPGIESPVGGRDFPHPSRPALGSTQPPTKWVQCIYRV
jgi:hypothetical protein